MLSAAETSAMRVREAEQQIRCDVEAEMQKLQADEGQEAEYTRTLVDNLASKLEQLTTQLNEYKPAQEVTLAVQGEQLSMNVEMRL